MHQNKSTITHDADGVDFTIYRTTKQARSGPKKYWLLADYSTGKRRLLSHTTLEDARHHADQIRAAMSKGRADRQSLTPGQWQDLVLAQEVVRSWHNNETVHSAVKEYGICWAMLDGQATVLDAVKFYLSHHQDGPGPKRTRFADASERYYQNKVQTGKSEGHLKNLKSRLHRLVEALPEGVHIDELNAANLESAILDFNLGAKTVNEYRGILCNFFGWAARQKLVLRGCNPGKELEQRKIKHKEIEFLRVADLRKILSLAPARRPDLLPMIVLTCFAGLRPSEAVRLDWTEIGNDYIRLPGTKSKTGFSRQIPVAANLKAWLAAWRKPSGSVCPPVNLTNVNRAIEKFSDIKLAHDAMRHGFGSHRAMLLGDVARVALEMGNTLTVCRRHYANPFVNMIEAEEWFAMMPTSASNIIPMLDGNTAQNDMAVNNS